MSGIDRTEGSLIMRGAGQFLTPSKTFKKRFWSLFSLTMSVFFIKIHVLEFARRKGSTEELQRRIPERIPPTTLLLQSSTMLLISKIALVARPILLLIVRVILSETLLPSSSPR